MLLLMQQQLLAAAASLLASAVCLLPAAAAGGPCLVRHPSLCPDRPGQPYRLLLLLQLLLPSPRPAAS